MNSKFSQLIDSLFANNLENFQKEYKQIYQPQLVEENCHGIKGIWYIKNYLNKDEIKFIKNKINETNFVPITAAPNSRRVAHFGYLYSYDRTGIKKTIDIPEYFQKLVTIDRINNTIKKDILDKEFQQLIINEYKSKQCIAYHTDHTSQFGPIIACITIGEPVPIRFKLDGIEKVVNIEEGSLYIMTGDARYKWKHSLKNNKNANRYSLTYRTII